jgi:hypothetical protein
VKALIVFSGARPRAPRWPCKSNALALPEVIMAAAMNAMCLFVMGVQPV